MNKFKIVTFYEFTKINELNELKDKLNHYLVLKRIKGTILNLFIWFLYLIFLFL